MEVYIGEIGSIHWFNTITSQIKDIGELLYLKSEYLTDEQIKDYGKLVFDLTKHLIDNKDILNLTK